MYAQTGGGRNIICSIPEDDHLVIILNNIQCPKLDEICVEVFKILYGVEE